MHFHQMGAAKALNPGYVFRGVRPSVKHFFKERSSCSARTATDRSFSQNRRCFQRTGIGKQWRLTTQHARVASPCAVQQCRFLIAAGYEEATVSFDPDGALFPLDHVPVPSAFSTGREASLEDQESRDDISIEELLKTFSDMHHLNSEFWGQYKDIPSMAQASDKHDILQITQNFALIRRKHLNLFQRLKKTVLQNLDMWAASDLAVLCHAWGELGFMHEDVCVAMAGRITATVHACSAQELCQLMDTYATARCSIQSVTLEITKHTMQLLDQFSCSQLCLHASSYARLAIPNRQLFELIAERLVSISPLSNMPDGTGFEHLDLTARDFTLAAYSFAKLGFFFDSLFEAVARGALCRIKNFTARDLQILMVAFARAQHRNDVLLLTVSRHAQKKNCTVLCRVVGFDVAICCILPSQ